MEAKFIIFYYWILALSQCQAETWNCDYGSDSIGNYRCDLRSNNKTAVDVTRIEGQHIADNSDDEIKALYIKRNLKTFSSIFCQKFENLELIHVWDIEIGSFNEHALDDCRNLKMIDLTGNKLSEFPENLLSENLKLIDIRIITNQLTSLPENFLKNQNQLKVLNLHGNQISSLPSKFFDSLVNLEDMRLSENKLQVIDPKWFVSLKKLKQLGLHLNQFSEVAGGLFKSLKNLEYLWLYWNKIKTLNPDSFESLQNLKYLALFLNQISELPRGVFVPLKNLNELLLDSNKLRIIHSNSFGSYNNLTKIGLRDNKVKALDEKLVDQIEILNLDMENNLCINENIEVKSKEEMKEKLQKCFKNYQLRMGAQLEVSTVTNHRPIQSTLGTIPLWLAQRPESSTITPTPVSSMPNSLIPALPQSSPQTTSPATCGSSKVIEGRIIGGNKIARAAFPWIAALERTNGEFFCGGTLISNRKVVTAAHCIQGKGKQQPILAREFNILLGVHNLDVRTEVGRVAFAVENIHVHDDWNPQTEKYDADIAVLVLEGEVTFKRNIQPICLIDPNSAINDISSGSVVGFGKSEDISKKHENIAKILDMPIHSTDDCIENNYVLGRFLSKRTFCAGTGSGVGVCDGDSGSGLYISQGNVFYLRGIVSASLYIRNYTISCDVDNYSIFTDVLKFYDWIHGINVNEIAEIFDY